MEYATFTDEFPQNTTFLQYPHETACFSGHRPSGFPAEPIAGIPVELLVRIFLAALIEHSLRDGYRYFINGLARGVDQWAVEYLCCRKQADTRNFYDIHLIGIEPQPHSLRKNATLWSLRSQFDAVATVPYYGSFAFLRRNDDMLAHSDRLLCILRQNKGGTFYTYHQAVKQNRQIYCIPLAQDRPFYALAELLWQYGSIGIHTSEEILGFLRGVPEAMQLIDTFMEKTL